MSATHVSTHEHIATPSSVGMPDSFVPGTCVTAPPSNDASASPGRRMSPRDASLRPLYAQTALAYIPRLLGAVDRNPFRPTYGCFDREFWHYRTSSFPSEMYQEGVWPLALVYSHALPGNRWYQSARVRELAIAGMRFSARSAHRDGSCDDYYPYERALGAAAFSLAAVARAYRLVDVDDPQLLTWIGRRADWLRRNNESGRLANHHAIAALALLSVWQITGEQKYREAAKSRVRGILEWQSAEGWFEEYGGADPGYHSVTVDALAKYRQAAGADWLDDALSRAVEFARWFLHPDGSYGGEYGSRGTYHFYPHGMELLADRFPAAADLADGYLKSLVADRAARFDDDRMYVHRLGSLIEAYLDWSPRRPSGDPVASTTVTRYFRHAGILVDRGASHHVVISAARGGVFKCFAGEKPARTDGGLVVETTSGQVAVSHGHDLSRDVKLEGAADDSEMPKPVSSGLAGGGGPQVWRLSHRRDHLARAIVVSGSLNWCSFETATPVKQAAFHLFMSSVGRWSRNLVRRLLQRRLITARKACPIQLTRRVEIRDDPSSSQTRLRIVDEIELLDPRLRIKRMSFGTDHQVAYIAASNVYQETALQPWTDLGGYVDALNTRRAVTIVREL